MLSQLLSLFAARFHKMYILQFSNRKNAKPLFPATFSKIHDISLYFKYFRVFFGKNTDFVNLDEKDGVAS